METALAPAAIVAGGATFLPWLPTIVANASGRSFWTPTPGVADLGYAFALMVGWGLPWLLGACIVLPLAALGVFVLATRQIAVREGAGTQDRHIPVLGLAVIAGLAFVPLVWLYSQFHSFFDSRYFGAGVAPLAIAAACGSCWLWPRIRPGVVRAAAGTGLALLLLGGMVAWIDQWRAEVGLTPAGQLLAVLEQEMRPGDVALALDARSYFQVAYLLGHEGTRDHLPGPLFTWSTGSEPFFYGQSLISPDALATSSRAAAAGWTATLPGLAPDGRIWLIALANGSAEDLGFRPLMSGELAEVRRIVLAPAGEAGQLVQLRVPGS
jgi:hypothetical protein